MKENKVSILVTAHSFIEKSGVDIYTENLFKYLSRINPDITYLFIVNKVSVDYFYIQSENIQFIQPSKMLDNQVGKILWYTFLAGRFIRKNGISLVFNNTATGNFIIARNVPIISCLHDLAEFHLKNKYSAVKIFYRKYICLNINKLVTDQFIAISENTRADMIKYLHIKSEKINVVYNGVNHLMDAGKSISAISERSYLLYVGRLDPAGKNLLRLLDAFRIITDAHPDMYLYLVGNSFRGSEMVFERITVLGLQKKVKLFGYVDELTLSSLYLNADLFIFPSLYEGFGFPILEAMKFSVPVVCSNTSSLPEIGGEAALYFNPYNTENIADTIEKVLQNSELRESLQKKGPDRYRMFTWEKCAAGTYKVLEKLLKQIVYTES